MKRLLLAMCASSLFLLIVAVLLGSFLCKSLAFCKVIGSQIKKNCSVFVKCNLSHNTILLTRIVFGFSLKEIWWYYYHTGTFILGSLQNCTILKTDHLQTTLGWVRYVLYCLSSKHPMKSL